MPGSVNIRVCSLYNGNESIHRKSGRIYVSVLLTTISIVRMMLRCAGQQVRWPYYGTDFYLTSFSTSREAKILYFSSQGLEDYERSILTQNNPIARSGSDAMGKLSVRFVRLILSTCHYIMKQWEELWLKNVDPIDESVILMFGLEDDWESLLLPEFCPIKQRSGRFSKRLYARCLPNVVLYAGCCKTIIFFSSSSHPAMLWLWNFVISHTGAA